MKEETAVALFPCPGVVQQDKGYLADILWLWWLQMTEGDGQRTLLWIWISAQKDQRNICEVSEGIDENQPSCLFKSFIYLTRLRAFAMLLHRFSHVRPHKQSHFIEVSIEKWENALKHITAEFRRFPNPINVGFIYFEIVQDHSEFCLRGFVLWQHRLSDI